MKVIKKLVIDLLSKLNLKVQKVNRKKFRLMKQSKRNPLKCLLSNQIKVMKLK